MTNTHQREYLSFGDALFLYLERAGTPLNIASLALFEGDMRISDLRKFVASKLPRIPRYLQRVVMPAFNVGLPYWEFASDFAIEDHVREVRLRHGTPAELKAATAATLSPTMDRQHPLWDLTLIRGLKGERSGLIARVHHCLADGISGMGLLNAIMDASPAVPELKNRKVRVPRPKITEPGADLITSAMHSWFSMIERVLKAGSEVLTLAERATKAANNGDAELNNNSHGPIALDQKTMIRLAAELSEFPERLPFNAVCQGPQRFEWTEASYAELKEVRDAAGTTLNDVALTVLTAAFRRYCEQHGVDVRGKSLRIVVPVSTRRHREAGELGNHITFAPFSSPLGVRSPKKLLDAVHERMQFVKTAHVAEFVSFAGILLGAIPTPFQAVLAPVLSGLPISVCNTICTHVPGPKTPLYLMGHKMLSAYPYVPIGGEMGVNCAVLSYNGTVYFGFTGDAGVVPDLEKFPKFVDESIAELKRSTNSVRAAARRRKAAAHAQVRTVIEAPAAEPAVAVQAQPAPEESKPIAMAATAGYQESAA